MFFEKNIDIINVYDEFCIIQSVSFTVILKNIYVGQCIWLNFLPKKLKKFPLYFYPKYLIYLIVFLF